MSIVPARKKCSVSTCCLYSKDCLLSLVLNIAKIVCFVRIDCDNDLATIQKQINDLVKDVNVPCSRPFKRLAVRKLGLPKTAFIRNSAISKM